MEAVLISGVSGFLGSNLALGLSESYQVVGLKRSTSSIERIANIPNLISLDLDNVLLDKIFKQYRFKAVFHTAVCYGKKNENVSDIIQTNVVLGIKLAEYSSLHKVPVFFNTDTFFSSNALKQEYLNIYTMTKRHLREFLPLLPYQIQIINCKLGHVYGYKDNEDKFITLILKNILENKKEILLSKGEQRRDFIYIEDVINAYMLLLNNASRFPQFIEFDIGIGKQVSIKKFCTYLLKTYQKHRKSDTFLHFGALPYRKNEPMYIKENVSPLFDLGFKPKYDYKKGIEKMIELSLDKYNRGGVERNLYILYIFSFLKTQNSKILFILFYFICYIQFSLDARKDK